MVKQGYKHTEIGIIPIDWTAQQMRELTVLMTNGFVGAIKNHYVVDGNGPLYIQGFNVEENAFNFTGIKYISDDFHRMHLRSELHSGDILTIQTGDIGVTAYVEDRLSGSNCQALIISRFKSVVDSKFFSYYFNFSNGRKRLKEIETGTTMKHINVSDLKCFYVPVPPTKREQERIATALSDMDNLIEATEKLIAKKKAVKQGVMQELLTEKRRLDGFNDEWAEYRLEELLKVTSKNSC